jgi:cation diffusion facilitator family transporter
VIYAALAGNLAIAIIKLTASLFTGSSAMLTEAIHSFVDTGDQVLLLFGLRQAKREPDERHPFGYGLELYFWAFVVAVMIFLLGGAFSIYEGAEKLRQPASIGSAWVNFVVLGASMVFEGISFALGYREFRGRFGNVSLWTGIRRSKDPSLFAVLLEDSAALAGLVIAAIGIGASTFFDYLSADGIASIAIGALLVATAVVLANETRSLLAGESASPDVIGKARALLASDPRITRVKEIKSLHLGPSEVLLAITFELQGELTLEQLRDATQQMREQIEAEQPVISYVFFQLAN